MKLLKKGAKGKEVEELQKLLNKKGAKLLVDGIFGPLTDKALRLFQKKAKLMADGVAGPMTLAALKTGKAPPEMTVPSYEQKALALNGSLDEEEEELQMAVDAALKHIEAGAAAAKAELEKVAAAYKAGSATRKEVKQLATGIAKKQKDFEKLRLSNPPAAEKLLKEIETAHAKVEAGLKKIGHSSAAAVEKVGAKVQEIGHKSGDKVRSILQTAVGRMRGVMDKVL